MRQNPRAPQRIKMGCNRGLLALKRVKKAPGPNGPEPPLSILLSSGACTTVVQKWSKKQQVRQNPLPLVRKKKLKALYGVPSGRSSGACTTVVQNGPKKQQLRQNPHCLYYYSSVGHDLTFVREHIGKSHYGIIFLAAVSKVDAIAATIPDLLQAN